MAARSEEWTASLLVQLSWDSTEPPRKGHGFPDREVGALVAEALHLTAGVRSLVISSQPRRMQL